MDKHTPGPWKWYLDMHGMIDLRTPHSGQLLVMDYGSMPTKRPVLRFAERGPDDRGGLMLPANKMVGELVKIGFVDIDNPDARLIEAAPEMYDALRDVGCAFSDIEIDKLGIRVLIEKVRAAIAKATEETNPNVK